MSELLQMAKDKDMFKELGESDITGYVRRCEDGWEFCWSVKSWGLHLDFNFYMLWILKKLDFDIFEYKNHGPYMIFLRFHFSFF